MHEGTLKGQQSDPVAAEYARLASDYDKRWRFYNEATIRETVARLHLPRKGRLLDLGCGTGNLIKRIQEEWSGINVVGVDLSSEMLQVARGKVGSATLLIASRAQLLPFRQSTFDVIVSCSAFHFWRQPQQALGEIRRVLRAGGELVITDWCDDYLMCKIYDLYLRICNSAHYRTYGSRRYQSLLRESGFRVLSFDRYKINWLWGLMTVRATVDSRS